MKKILLTLSATLALAYAASGQNILAYWSQNFNDLPNSGFGFEPGDFPQAADEGTGTINLVNFDTTTSLAPNTIDTIYTYIPSFAGTALSAPLSYASGGSLSPQGGADNGGVFSNNGMSIDISVSTVSASGITVSWDQRGTSSGFASRAFSYSVDGGSNFTLFDTDLGVLTSTWVTEIYDLSSITSLDNNANVVFRITLDGAAGSTGNNRFDNILVSAAVIPEPSTYAALLGLLGLGLVVWRRRH